MNNNKSVQKARKRANKSRANSRETPASAIRYTGPIDDLHWREACDSHTIVITNGGLVAASAAGVLETVFTPQAQASANTNWAALVGLFGEYRILAFKLAFSPLSGFYNATVTNSISPFYTVVDRNTATALTSEGQALGYSSCMMVDPYKHWSREVRMEQLEEAQFISTSSSPAGDETFYIKCYGAGNTANALMAKFVSYVVVQFRGFQ